MCETSLGFRDLQRYIEGISFEERLQRWPDYLAPHLERGTTFILAQDLPRFIQGQAGHLFASPKTLEKILAAQRIWFSARSRLLQQGLWQKSLLNYCGVLWNTKHVWVTRLLKVEYVNTEQAKGKILWVTQDDVTVFEIRWQERNFSYPSKPFGPPGRYTNNAS